MKEKEIIDFALKRIGSKEGLKAMKKELLKVGVQHMCFNFGDNCYLIGFDNEELCARKLGECNDEMDMEFDLGILADGKAIVLPWDLWSILFE